MALVCDIKSDANKGDANPENAEDLEDGEIEDDDETVEELPAPVVENGAAQQQTTPSAPPIKPQVEQPKPVVDKVDRDRPRDKSKEKRDRRHKDKESRHMTEAEKSILHLRRKERLEREKWNKYRKEHQNVETQDDFAINLEKTLASILKKDRVTSDEDKEEDRRTNKRKKKIKDNDHKSKQRKMDSPNLEEIAENEILNIRGGSPEPRPDKEERLRSPRSEQSYDSEYSSDHSRLEDKAAKTRRESRRENRKANKNKNKNRDRNFKRDRSRERNVEPVTDAKGICIFYLNGKCNKNDCIYSHEAVPPMKLELCKFYLMDCCAKGENCSYMHSEFPCKFYHMGLPCTMGDNCKFAHGKPLSDGLKQILFKHIETAPRDILGGFPRLSREETLNMMDLTQKNLVGMYKETNADEKTEKSDDFSGDGTIPSLFDIDVPVPVELRDELSDTKGKSEKSGRNRPSRWQEPDSRENVSNLGLNFGPFNFSQDLDMRINSNGDVDMRTLPPHPLTSLPQPLPSSLTPSTDSTNMETDQVKNAVGDVDIRNLAPNFATDVDIRLHTTFDTAMDRDQRFLGKQDTDIRQLPLPVISKEPETIKNDRTDIAPSLSIPSNLPKMQRELYMRIQAQQRENPAQEEKNSVVEDDRELQDTNWYSDDDDDDDENRLTIKVDNEEFGSGKDKEEDEDEDRDEKTEKNSTPSISYFNAAPIKPLEVVEKLGDLSKINITADITKLLSSLSATLPTISPMVTPREPEKEPRDPRQAILAEDTPSVLRSPQGPKAVSDPRLSQDPRTSEPPRDPRRGGLGSAPNRSDKLSIYEQGGLDMEDIDLRIDGADDFKGSSRSDVDLRTLGLPFKGMQNYTPATEIDASFSSHPPISWKVSTVDIPRPDYSGLKLSINDAEKTGDPRLRKIFRLSVEEKDTPTSPKESPRASTTVRIDPRLRKVEDTKSLKNIDTSMMNYTQQLNTLQSSAFYQSLTSNQKLMLNQELASRADQTGSHDPILNSILANLNLIPGVGNTGTLNTSGQGTNFGIALNILQTVNKMTPMSQNGIMGPNVNPNMLNPMSQGIMQPGLLGAAPGVPNIPQDFQMNFDPRNQNGLLGNGPRFSNFEPPGGPGGHGGFQNYPGDDFYPPENNQGGFRGNQGRNDRGGNFVGRERRRGGRNHFGRNQGNKNQFRRNQGGGRSNRAHTPP
ncbi:hypothetical protein HHI36_021368 [Cryptolaemus montrouzieri]|uniref:C3H1-type domain-containing protein n=1 Tax=Cryptolaemus montrouzieri TaxID=559131 RepID=A0ABD2MWX9_9CUCU